MEKRLSLRKQFLSLGDIVQTVCANFLQWFTYLVSGSKIKLDFQEFFDLCYCQSWWTADVFTYQFSHGLLLHRVVTETEQNEVASSSYQLLSGNLVEKFPLTCLETSVGKRLLTLWTNEGGDRKKGIRKSDTEYGYCTLSTKLWWKSYLFTSDTPDRLQSEGHPDDSSLWYFDAPLTASLAYSLVRQLLNQELIRW